MTPEQRQDAELEEVLGAVRVFPGNGVIDRLGNVTDVQNIIRIVRQYDHPAIADARHRIVKLAGRFPRHNEDPNGCLFCAVLGQFDRALSV